MSQQTYISQIQAKMVDYPNIPTLTFDLIIEVVEPQIPATAVQNQVIQASEEEIDESCNLESIELSEELIPGHLYFYNTGEPVIKIKLSYLLQPTSC